MLRATVESDEGGTVGEEEDKRLVARLMQNRGRAQLSWKRKKRYVEELEKVKSMHSMINDLSSKISFVVAEKAALQQPLSSGGRNCSPPEVYPSASLWGVLGRGAAVVAV